MSETSSDTNKPAQSGALSERFPKSYDPLASDQPRKDLENLQLEINEKAPGIFPQGSAGLDTSQGDVRDSITPQSASEFNDVQPEKRDLQPRAFSGGIKEDINLVQGVRPDTAITSADQPEFSTPAMMQPESEAPSESSRLAGEPLIDQQQNVDQPDKNLFENKGIGTENIMSSADLAPSEGGQSLPQKLEISQESGGQEGFDENQTDQAKRTRQRKLVPNFSVDQGQLGPQQQQQVGQSQQQTEEGDEIPDTFLECVNRDIAADIQSQEARHLGEGGVTHKGGYGSQARAAAARNEPLGPLPGPPGRRRSRKYSNQLDLTPGYEDIGQAVHITVDLDKVTREEAAALQSIEAKFHGGVVPKGSLAAAAQAAAALNETPGETSTSTPSSGNATPMRRRSSVGANNAPGANVHQPIAPSGAKGQTVHPHSCGLHVEQVSDNALLIEADFDKITREDAAFIQALEAKLYGGVVPRGSLAAQAQAAAARNEPLPGQQPLSPQSGGGGGGTNRGGGSRRTSFSNQRSQQGGQGQQANQQGGNQIESGRAAEELGHIRLEVDLDKVTRHEAAVLQSAEAQLNPSGLIPKGSIAAAAQSAAVQHEPPMSQQPQVVLEPIKTAAVDEENWIAKDDIGNIHVEAKLDEIRPNEASVLQSMEAQMEGIAPRGGMASLAMSATRWNNPHIIQNPLRTGAIIDESGIAKEDLGNIHIEVDLNKVTPSEAEALEQVETKMEGKPPKDGIGYLAKTAAAHPGAIDQIPDFRSHFAPRD